MLFKKIWTKNSNSIVKNNHTDGLKNQNFKFLAVVGQFKLKKNVIFLFILNIPLVSLFEKVLYVQL